MNIVSKYYSDIQNNLKAVYEAKNADYGNSFEKSIETWGIKAGAVRIGDKYERMVSLLTGKSPAIESETLLDTVMDLANYATMLAAYLYGNIQEEVMDGCRRG